MASNTGDDGVPSEYQPGSITEHGLVHGGWRINVEPSTNVRDHVINRTVEHTVTQAFGQKTDVNITHGAQRVTQVKIHKNTHKLLSKCLGARIC